MSREAYERVLVENPNHAKVLQQLGWLYQQQNSSGSHQELAISFLTRSLEADMNDAQTWYFLGRCYINQKNYMKAYDAYQQAVYRDGRNPTFWCSIGVLYYQINQFSDALDAYTRAIRLNPYISEVWYDLGALYESCNNQISDAIDAYTRALELEPNSQHIKQRLEYLQRQQRANGGGDKGGDKPTASTGSSSSTTATAGDNENLPNPIQPKALSSGPSSHPAAFGAVRENGTGDIDRRGPPPPPLRQRG